MDSEMLYFDFDSKVNQLDRTGLALFVHRLCLSFIVVCVSLSKNLWSVTLTQMYCMIHSNQKMIN